MSSATDILPHTLRNRWFTLGGVFLLAAAYFFLAMIGGFFPKPNPYATLIWLPIGLSVGVVYRLGYWYTPGVFLGAFLVHLQFHSPLIALGVAVGNTLAPLSAVMLLRNFQFSPKFRRLYDALVFLGVAILSAMLSSLNGTLLLGWSAGMTTSQLQSCCANWWLGDSLGILMAGIPVLTFDRKMAEVRKVIIAIALCASATLLLILTHWIENVAQYPLLLISNIVVISILIRFGIWPASICVVLVVNVIVIAELSGFSGSVLPPSTQRTVSIWSHLVILEVTMLLLNAILMQRNKVEAALRANQAEYTALVEDNPAMVLRISREGHYTFLNKAYRETKDYIREDLIGKNIFDIMHPGSKEGLQKALVECVRTGESARHEGPFGRVGEPNRWYRWSVRTVKLPDSEDYEFQLVGIDVTQSYLERQEQRALDEQMLHTQRLESLGVLAGGIAHDFNNLLTGVLGHAELGMEISHGDSEMQSHFKPILEGARRCADLTRQLMAYAGKGKLRFELVQLNHTLRETVDLVRVSVPRGVELILDIDRPLTSIEADETQIRQVLMNLIINAGEAIGDQPGKITVRTDEVIISESDFSRTTASFLRGGKYVRLLVSDTGSGMDESTQARIFDPFFTTKFAGRGLGLASVMGIVKAHGGTIHVESDIGQGTTFTVLLPVAISSEVLKAQSSLSEDKPIEVTGNDEFSQQPIKRPLALLVVSDHKTSEQTQPMLVELGWDVVVFYDEDTAQSHFQADPSTWSLLIWDAQLWNRSTQSLLTEFHEVPLLLLANSASDIGEHFPAIPSESILYRPFRFQDLQQKIALLHNPTPVG